MDEPAFDRQKYGQLLAQTYPAIIDSPEEHERLLTAAEQLMDRGGDLSAEERKLLELLVVLIEIFESEIERQESADDDEDEGVSELPRPHETLSRLLAAREWGEDALNDIFGNPRLVSQVLSGQQPISKGQAKALGKLFAVPPKLFLE